jgi:hypothetical protein
VIAIAQREWAFLALVVLVFLPLLAWGWAQAERLRRDPSWRPWPQQQILTRPLVSGVCGGIGFGLLMTISLVDNNDAPIATVLLVAMAFCIPLGVAITYTARSDLRRRESRQSRRSE